MPRTKEQDNSRKRVEYFNDPMKHCERTLAWRNENREKQMVSSAKIRAREKSREFSLVYTDITIPEVCPVFGVPLVLGAGKGRQNYSPSLDRIDCSKGYTKDNIRVISWRANNLISDGSLEEFEQIVRFLRGS